MEFVVSALDYLLGIPVLGWGEQVGFVYKGVLFLLALLIFTAYILFTVRLEAAPGSLGEVTAEQVEGSCVRVGGILLIIGVLHGLNIVLMPVLGRLFSLNRRLPHDHRP